MDLGDLDFLASMLTDPETMRYFARCYTREESESWIKRQMDRYARFGHGLWLVLAKATKQRVGQVGLVLQQVEGVEELELAWYTHRPYWRRGLATEAATACRDYAFETLARTRLISLIRPANTPSQGVARKIGMTPEDRLVQHAGLEHMVFSTTKTMGE
jgi:ribosomal-protein-alanine N-acetyltransferase